MPTNGVLELERALRRLQRRVEDVTPALTEMGNAQVSQTLERFERERSPSGSPWAPLKPATIARRRKGGSGAKILQDTGTLKNSISYQIEGDAVRVGSNVIYAPTHQYGDSKRNIPARPFLGVSASDQKELIRIVERHIQEATQKSGLLRRVFHYTLDLFG